MNKEEAKEIIRQQLEPYRRQPYSELISMINAEPINYEFKTASGNIFQIEIQAYWDDKPNENIRIMGSIDDGGWRAFSPLSNDFIKSPTDEFIGE